MSERPAELDNRVVILNGFTDPEIIAIMNVVKSIYATEDIDAYARFVGEVENHAAATDFARRLLRVVGAAKQIPETQTVTTGDLIFAKTTEQSLQTKIADVIVDMSGDHEYLRNNPPGKTPPPGAGSTPGRSPA